MSLFNSLLSSRKRLLAGFLLLFLLFTLPFAVYLIKQEVEIRKKAVEVPYQIPVLILSYIPLKADGTIDTDITGDLWTNNLQELRDWIENTTFQTLISLEEASKYHGYKDSGAPASLDYSIIVRKEFLSPIPHSGYLAWDKPGVYRPDYYGILSNLDICNHVDNRGIKEVWMFGYHYGEIEPDESNMSMGTVSQNFWNHDYYGDVSNSQQINDMPTCNKTYTLYGYNYSRGLGEILEDHTHQMEAVFNFIDRDLFWNKFVEPHGETDIVNHCGWTHCPPNTKANYDWRNEADVLSDCEDWKPDGAGEAKLVDCHTWYGETCLDDGGVKFKIWWMQNIPGKDNNLVYEEKKLRNWWDFMGDFDLALEVGKSLFFPTIPSPLPSPNPTPTPIPSPSPSVSPTPSLIPSPTPTFTPTPTPSQIVGDFNGDGQIDLLDFEIFRDFYVENL